MLYFAAPSVPQIEKGVQWGLAQKEAGRPVYVHCAHGEWIAWGQHAKPAHQLRSPFRPCVADPALAGL